MVEQLFFDEIPKDRLQYDPHTLVFTFPPTNISFVVSFGGCIAAGDSVVLEFVTHGGD